MMRAAPSKPAIDRMLAVERDVGVLDRRRATARVRRHAEAGRPEPMPSRGLLSASRVDGLVRRDDAAAAPDIVARAASHCSSDRQVALARITTLNRSSALGRHRLVGEHLERQPRFDQRLVEAEIVRPRPPCASSGAWWRSVVAGSRIAISAVGVIVAEHRLELGVQAEAVDHRLDPAPVRHDAVELGEPGQQALRRAVGRSTPGSRRRS